MAAPLRPGWRNPRIWLILLSVFLCGSLAGALAFRYGLQNPVQPTAPYWSEAGKEIAFERLKRELDLTEKQAQEIAQILDDFTKYMHTIQAQMDAVRADGKRRILSVLDERQKKKFHEMLSGLSDRKGR
jgi:uncharacterized membrane protein